MIDVSIGSIAGMASVAVGMASARLSVPWVASLVLGVFLGAFAGFLNSRLILKFKVSAFLATIAAMYIYRGAAMSLSNGYTIYPLPDAVTAFGAAAPLGVSWAWWIFFALIIAGELVLRKTIWGLTVKATGSDRIIAFDNEVNVDRVNTQTFMLCGALAALAGILLTARVQAGQPTMGQGWELNAIAAAAIGGVSLSGYTGSMVGVLLGVLLIQVLTNGLVALGASAYLQPIEVGVILACTAIIDVRRRAKLNL